MLWFTRLERPFYLVSVTPRKPGSAYFLIDIFPLPLAGVIFISQMGYSILSGIYLSTWCIVHRVGGTSSPNAFYPCSKKALEAKSDSSSAGDCGKADSMCIQVRMYFLCGTNLIKTLSRNRTENFIWHLLNLSFPSITKSACSYLLSQLSVIKNTTHCSLASV